MSLHQANSEENKMHMDDNKLHKNNTSKQATQQSKISRKIKANIIKNDKITLKHYQFFTICYWYGDTTFHSIPNLHTVKPGL